MSNYSALKMFLERQTDRTVMLSFGEIERIIGTSLPNSAKVHQAWWSASTHPHARTWEESGYKAVNMRKNQAIGRMEFVNYDTKTKKNLSGNVHVIGDTNKSESTTIDCSENTAVQVTSTASPNIIKNALFSFFDSFTSQNVEVYNEFSLQHELGIFLRYSLPDYKVQFERNVSYFGLTTQTVKKEIDIVVFRSNISERYAIELKYPQNGQYPEQMFSFVKDIKFMEELKESGFTNTYSVTLVGDRPFYEGKVNDGIYRFFRSENAVYGEIQKPTGKRDEYIPLNGIHRFEWLHLGDGRRYYIVEL